MFGSGSALDYNRSPEYYLLRAKLRVSDAKKELEAAEREFIRCSNVVAEKVNGNIRRQYV